MDQKEALQKIQGLIDTFQVVMPASIIIKGVALDNPEVIFALMGYRECGPLEFENSPGGLDRIRMSFTKNETDSFHTHRYFIEDRNG